MAAYEKRVNGFKMWLYRRILKIWWFDNITNGKALNRTGCYPKLLPTMKTKKARILWPRNEASGKIFPLITTSTKK